VVSRIARLEREGVVAGYGVRLGTRMDQATVRAWCSLSVLPQSAPQVLRALAAMPEVEEVSAVSGPFDYLAFLALPSHERSTPCSIRSANRWRAPHTNQHRAQPQDRPPQRGSLATILIAACACYISPRGQKVLKHLKYFK
jgi:hypothetical protein